MILYVLFPVFSHSLPFLYNLICLIFQFTFFHTLSVLVFFFYFLGAFLLLLFSDHPLSWKLLLFNGCRCTEYWNVCAFVAGWELLLFPWRSVSVFILIFHILLWFLTDQTHTGLRKVYLVVRVCLCIYGFHTADWALVVRQDYSGTTYTKYTLFFSSYHLLNTTE